MGSTIAQKIIHTHIMVIYDGIDNSVFCGQVLAPLLAYAKQNPAHAIVLISYEKNPTISKPPNIPATIIFIPLKKHAFMGTWSLFRAIYALRTYVASLQQYAIIARGPIAGYIALHARTQQCQHITVQVRGLLAQEYAYAHMHAHWSSYFVHTFRAKLYAMLEKKIFGTQCNNVSFEAVSPALKQHLVTYYHALENTVSVAQNDIPALIDKALLQQWRKDMRLQLMINEQTYVYCYNGSAKPWQCPEDVILFFMEQQKQKKDILLLLLTQDISLFASLLTHYHVPKEAYRLLHIAHTEIYRYLAAADSGILFRKSHIVNWISRPTKALEYWAVGLPIMHNNTVAYLMEQEFYYNNNPTINADNRLARELAKTAYNPSSHNQDLFSGTSAPMPPI